MIFHLSNNWLFIISTDLKDHISALKGTKQTCYIMNQLGNIQKNFNKTSFNRRNVPERRWLG